MENNDEIMGTQPEQETNNNECITTNQREDNVITVNYKLSVEEAKIGIKNSDIIKGLGGPQIIKTVMLVIVLAITIYNFVITKDVETYKLAGVVIFSICIITLGLIWLVPYYSIKKQSNIISKKNATVGFGEKYIYVGEDQDGLIEIDKLPQAKSVKGVLVILLNSYKAIFVPERVFAEYDLKQVHEVLGIE